MKKQNEPTESLEATVLDDGTVLRLRAATTVPEQRRVGVVAHAQAEMEPVMAKAKRIMTQTPHAFLNATFKTHDLYLAAFLVTRGHALLRLEGDHRRAFVFPSDASADADTFYRGESIPARDYVHAVKDLKTRLHA